jgi:glycosyltransferase involved in cell wall biosynthesis
VSNIFPNATIGVRVLHLSAVDHGGAGTAALRLHRAMIERGVASHMLIWDGKSSEAFITSIAGVGLSALRRFLGRAWYRLTSRSRYLFRGQRASLVSRSKLTEIAMRVQPNLIIVHYVSDFLRFADIALLHSVTGARVVFHLLDMGLLTGGCHFAWGCRAYRAQCGDCPALPGRSGYDASARTLADKKAIVRILDHVVVVPTDQLAQDAKGSSVFVNSRFERILIGVDSDSLRRQPQAEARAALGLTNEGSILFFGAQHLGDKRKGMHLLLAALQALAVDGMLQRNGVQLLIAGKIDGLAELDALNVPVIRLGFVDPERLSQCYCAADFFICPSIEDSGPMMVNEAIMSGTPVIGFPIGVLPDLVIDGETGLLASSMDAPGLLAALTRALGWSEARRTKAREACRELALARCSLDVQVNRFLALAEDTK